MLPLNALLYLKLFSLYQFQSKLKNTKMCGGAIISDFIDQRRGRKLTAADLWSDLDSISDLLGLDKDNKHTHARRQTNKGMIFHFYFLFN